MVLDLGALHSSEREVFHDGGKKKVTLNGIRGFTLNEPSAIEDLVGFHREVISRNGLIVPYSGATSSGLINPPKGFEERTVIGVHTQLIVDADQIDRCTAFRGQRGVIPNAVETSPSVPIDFLNKYLESVFRSRLPDDLSCVVDWDVTTGDCSGIGANLVTRAQGDLRRVIPALEANVLSNGEIRKARGRELAALRGTQGYAGTITRMTLPLRLAPRHQDVFFVILPAGTARYIWSTSVGHLQEALAPWGAHPGREGIEIQSIEVFGRSGLDLLVEKGNKEARDFRDELFETGQTVALMIPVRHGFDEAIKESHPLQVALSRWQSRFEANGATVVQLSSHDELARDYVERARRIRMAIPDEARRKAEETGASNSFDIGWGVEVPSRGFNPKHVRRAWKQGIEIYIDLQEECDRNEIPFVDNGHVKFVAPLDCLDHRRASWVPGEGLSDLHGRAIGQPHQARLIKAIYAKAEARLAALHGRKVGDVTHQVFLPGEKAYPNRETAWEFYRTWYPGVVHSIFQAIAHAGPEHNWRVPPELRRVMAREGFSLA